MDDILVIDVQVYPVESRHLLREKAGPSPLHLLQVAGAVDNVVKMNPVMAKQRADISLGAK